MSFQDRYSKATYDEAVFLNEELPNIYRSSYLIEGFYFTDRVDVYAVVDPKTHRMLLPDTGHPKLSGTRQMDTLVEQFQIPWSNIDTYITHLHSDHDGNCPYIFSQNAGEIFTGPCIPYEEERRDYFLRTAGFVEQNDLAVASECAYLMGDIAGESDYLDARIERDLGFTYSIGDYNFELISTPGHTPDHTCIVDKEKGILFAGDHVLDSAPGLMQYYPDDDLLINYLSSLKDLKDMNLRHVFMCHADSLHGNETINAFLDSLIAKYDKPLAKMLDVLKDCQNNSAYEIAEKYYSRLKGGLRAQPDNLRGRRVSISLSYLEYLCFHGMAKKETDEAGVRRYSLVDNCEILLPSKVYAGK